MKYILVNLYFSFPFNTKLIIYVSFTYKTNIVFCFIEKYNGFGSSYVHFVFPLWRAVFYNIFDWRQSTFSGFVD